MHAVVVRVQIEDFEAATKRLREEIVPRVRQAPGFVAGYWTHAKRNKGQAMIVFDSVETANAAAEEIEAGTTAPGIVKLEAVNVREVVEHA